MSIVDLNKHIEAALDLKKSLTDDSQKTASCIALITLNAQQRLQRFPRGVLVARVGGINCFLLN